MSVRAVGQTRKGSRDKLKTMIATFLLSLHFNLQCFSNLQYFNLKLV